MTQAASISTDPYTQEAFAARDREELLALILPIWAMLHEQCGVSQAHFPNAPGVSFLPVHTLSSVHGLAVSREKSAANFANFANGVGKAAGRIDQHHSRHSPNSRPETAPDNSCLHTVVEPAA